MRVQKPRNKENIMKKYLTTIFLIINIGVAQDNSEDKKEKLKFIFEPDSLSLNIGEELSLIHI